ncbi:thiamine-phosphate kinase [Trebonia kvetii]
MPAGPLTSVGIGDDAAVVGAPSGNVVAAVDMLIEGRHFLRDWSSAYDIGVKAAARSLSDIAAMGAVNTALLVALAAPGTLPASWAAELADGLAAEATRAGAGIAGGDTARADYVTLAVTALGDLAGRLPVLRSGARPGDVVAVAGLLGHSAAGLALLMSGVLTPPAATGGAPASVPPTVSPVIPPASVPPADAAAAPPAQAPAPAPDDALAGLVAAHLRPAPIYEAGPEAALLGATAMIDISDGLIADLGHIATASGVQVNISTPGLPIAPALLKAAKALPSTSGTTALEWVLTGGEDHALVAAFPPSVTLPPRWHPIGEVREGTGVTVDNATHAGPGGWQHFR